MSPDRPLLLAGRNADDYLLRLRRLLDLARPSAHFPEAALLDDHLRLLGPGGSHGAAPELRVDRLSGLPALAEFLGLRAEREVALEGQAVRAEVAAWHAELRRARLLPTSSVVVRLRRREGRTALLEVVHDRLDAASGCPLRYTALVAMRGGRHVAFREGDDVPEPTRRFVHLMERHAGADAELAFLLLSDLSGLKVEEVVRGQIGPLHFAGAQLPGLLAPLFTQVPDAAVLHLGFERAGVAVAQERNRDPLVRSYRDALSPESRALVEKRRQVLGYRVARERRLVCTADAAGPLETLLARADCRMVVRSG